MKLLSHLLDIGVPAFITATALYGAFTAHTTLQGVSCGVVAGWFLQVTYHNMLVAYVRLRFYKRG